jgi:hypothetical protein
MDWQPIETAPKDGKLVLVYAGFIGIASYYNWLGNGWQWCDDGEGLPYDPQPTHWMPLPAPPQD